MLKISKEQRWNEEKTAGRQMRLENQRKGGPNKGEDILYIIYRHLYV